MKVVIKIMNKLGIIFLALLFIVSAFCSYYFYFGFYLSLEAAKDPSSWSDFGGFFGGILGPLLNFITIVLLIKSLRIQTSSVTDLKEEVKRNKKSDKVNKFETTFFNMIDSQKDLFRAFNLSFHITKNQELELSGAKAVSQLEDNIQTLKDSNKSHQDIRKYIEIIDADDAIFTVTRTFANIVKLVKNRISNEEDFSSANRKDYYETLISFTDYSLFRLIMLSMNYASYESLDLLRDNEEFISVIKKLGAADYLKDI